MYKNIRLICVAFIFTTDMKWNLHVDHLVKKPSKRIYLILHLKRANCPTDILFMAYMSSIRPILLYAHPTFCNATDYLRERLLRVEKRIFRIIGDVYSKSLFTFGDRLCKNLLREVTLHATHPLRQFFLDRQRVSRQQCSLRRPKTKTKRFANSFIKYCP